ncbi:unknown [Prevotella sp. CAG:1058]|nr:unknown [Prevotella sp. CAG:1058]
MPKYKFNTYTRLWLHTKFYAKRTKLYAYCRQLRPLEQLRQTEIRVREIN